MKRYLLFSGPDYYPAGGWDDFQGDFDSLEEAKAAHTGGKYHWFHIVDTETGWKYE